MPTFPILAFDAIERIRASNKSQDTHQFGMKDVGKDVGVLAFSYERCGCPGFFWLFASWLFDVGFLLALLFWLFGAVFSVVLILLVLVEVAGMVHRV